MYLVGVSLTVPSRSCLFSQFYFVNIQCFAGNSLVQFNIISSSDQMRASMLVSSQLPGRRMRCRITIRRRCAVSFVNQQVGAVFDSNSLPRLHAHQRFSFLHSVSCFESIVSKENKIFVAQNVLFLGSESTRFVQSRENCKFIVVARSAVTAERSTKFSRDESTLERTSRVSGIPFWSRKMETRISPVPTRPKSRCFFGTSFLVV